jgi:hypothetical protein
LGGEINGTEAIVSGETVRSCETPGRPRAVGGVIRPIAGLAAAAGAGAGAGSGAGLAGGAAGAAAPGTISLRRHIGQPTALPDEPSAAFTAVPQPSQLNKIDMAPGLPPTDRPDFHA